MKVGSEDASRRLYALKRKLIFLRWRIAFHEAGHAVMALSNGIPIVDVAILPTAKSDGVMRGGMCRLDLLSLPGIQRKVEKDIYESEELLYKLLQVDLAGLVAESIQFGKEDFSGGRSDLKNFHRTLQRSNFTENIVSGSSIIKWREKLWDVCRDDLKRSDSWAWVERVANELIKSRVLTHIQVLKLRHRNIPPDGSGAVVNNKGRRIQMLNDVKYLPDEAA